MGVLPVHPDEEKDDEMEVTSESPNDLLALLNPIQGIRNHRNRSPDCDEEPLKTTEDPPKTEVTVHRAFGYELSDTQ